MQFTALYSLTNHNAHSWYYDNVSSRLAGYLRLGVSGSHARTSVAVPEPDVTVSSAATTGQ